MIYWITSGVLDYLQEFESMEHFKQELVDYLELFGAGVINPKVSGVHDQIQPEKKKPVPLLSANLYTGKCQQPSGKDKQ